MARELDDAILWMRTNELEIGTWLLQDRGRVQTTCSRSTPSSWRTRTTGSCAKCIGYLRRTFARLEVSSRTLFALIERGSCFAGTLLELALAADRSYMLADDDSAAPVLTIDDANFGLYPPVNGLVAAARPASMASRHVLGALRAVAGQPLEARRALELGLVTSAPDEIDWDDEVRIAIEERASLSPDALTGMEANLRFSARDDGNSNLRPSLALGRTGSSAAQTRWAKRGALKVYGKGEKPQFDWRRV